MDRRGFLTGLLAAAVAAGPLSTIAPEEISLRMITEYIPTAYAPVDVLYGIMSMDEYSERILAPMVNTLAENMARDIMDGDGQSGWGVPWR